MTKPFTQGDMVRLRDDLQLGGVVGGVQYEYLTENFAGEVVTIKEARKVEDSYWYKIQEMPFTISHEMILRRVKFV
jgi:hypothetical protein